MLYFLTYEYSGYPGVSAEGEAAAESLCPPADPVVHLPPPPISVPSGWTLQDPTSFGLPEGTTEWVWLPPLETTQGLEVNAVPRSALYTLGPYGSLISILESYDRARMQSIHGAESCFQRADESLREVRWLLPPARHGGKERRSGAGMDRHRHGFCEIQRNLLTLRYDCCGRARGASDSFALPEQLSRERWLVTPFGSLACTARTGGPWTELSWTR